MPEKLGVLFVDDEPQVLEGLRNLLRRDRARWDMVFAEGGQGALEQLRQRPFDVVVSDMRMPGMDGPTLLQRIKSDYPAMVRVVLSGQAEREAVLRALPVAQQFLSKPCSVETLRRTIERAERITRLVEDLPTRALIGGLYTLPTSPELYHRLVAALAAGSREQVAAIAAEDPALSAKVLQLANWECFGARRLICSIDEAVAALGLEVIGALVRTAQDHSPGGEASASVSRILQCARAAAQLARKLVADQERAGQAFAAGLLHDVALLALAGAPPPGGAVSTPGDPALAAIGGYLLSLWGLPEAVVEAVIHHRSPAASGRLEFEILGAVHVAVCLVNDFLASQGEVRSLVVLDLDYLEALGMTALLPRWRALGEAEVRSCFTENSRPP